jgi:hypothetical protein|tara:strand:- start:2022 stop:2537 length:516 start_codon:yes stop_codon:yes gene_type:complete
LKINEYTANALERVHVFMGMAFADLTPEQLWYRPATEANSMAWVGWHLTRGLDRRVSDMDGGGQTWVEGRWYEKFGLPANPTDYGVGHTSEQVDTIRPSDAGLILGYYDDVYRRTLEFLASPAADDHDRALEGSGNTLAEEMVGMATGNLQHVGQVGYIRGLIEGRRWYPR